MKSVRKIHARTLIAGILLWSLLVHGARSEDMPVLPRDPTGPECVSYYLTMITTMGMASPSPISNEISTWLEHFEVYFADREAARASIQAGVAELNVLFDTYETSLSGGALGLKVFQEYVARYDPVCSGLFGMPVFDQSRWNSDQMMPSDVDEAR